MQKSVLKSLAAALALVAFAGPATAQNVKPPVNYQGQWWTHPNGCTYSRAGRPGETMWFLQINTAADGCPTYIAGKTWGNVYKTQGPKIGQRS